MLGDLDAELLLIELQVDSDRLRISTRVLSWDCGQRNLATLSGMFIKCCCYRGGFCPGTDCGNFLGPGLRGPMIDRTESDLNSLKRYGKSSSSQLTN